MPDNRRNCICYAVAAQGSEWRDRPGHFPTVITGNDRQPHDQPKNLAQITRPCILCRHRFLQGNLIQVANGYCGQFYVGDNQSAFALA